VIKKILVAIDGSENSVKALDFALEMCEKYDANLKVVNVAESPAISAVPQDTTTISPESMIVFSKDLDQMHQEILKKALDHAQKVKPNIAITAKLREGVVASEIVAEAKESASDIVVIGHKGVGKVKELLGLGGSSEKVAHLAHCPVVIVR